jgi:autotransporter-associated beta strand protein
MALRYFDRNGTTAGFGTLTGAWDTTTASWTDSAAGTATPAAFTFTSADEAQFGATGATGTAGTATIAASLNVTVNKVRTQNLAAVQVIAAGAGGSLELAGTTPTIDVQSAGGLRLTCPLTGSGGFTKSGTGLLELDGTNNTISGTMTINAGRVEMYAVTNIPPISTYQINSPGEVLFEATADYSFASGTTFGGNGLLTVSAGPTANEAIVFPASCFDSFSGICELYASSTSTRDNNNTEFNQLPISLEFQSNAAAALTRHSIKYIGNGATYASTLFLYGFADVSFISSSTFEFQANNADSNAIILTGGISRKGLAGTATFTLSGSSTASNLISGVIEQLTFGTMNIRKDGVGRWDLSGTNTYRGTTTIASGVLGARSAAALGPDSTGTGGAISVTGGTLELAGGITLDKSGLNISTVTTASPTNAFQVPASGGDNTLEVGSITLNSTIRTEVGSGGVLRLANTGAISGATFGITKEGSGELDLNAAANTYTGAVAVNSGTLTVSASCAPSTAGPLGNASSAVTVTGTLKFDGASNSNVSRSVQLTGSAPALDASGTHHVHFSNVSQASGTRTLTLKGTSTATNQLQSALANGSGGTLSLTKEGAGQWQVTGTPTYTGATTVNAGTLDFGGQTLSLSGGVAMAGGTLANGNIGDTLVSAVTFTGGTVIALLDSTSTVTATSGTGRLQPLTADGSNSYTGNTTVQSGATLELVTDSNPGTVGDGKVTGASNVTVSGTLATGSGVNQRGQCRYGGNLTFAAGSVLAIGAAA